MLERNSSGALAQWWWTTDRNLFAAILILLATGFIMSVATSPVTVEGDADIYHFAKRQGIALIPTILIIIGISLFSIKQLPRLGLIIWIGALALCFFVGFAGQELNGARRWLRIAGFSLQPSEFLKPGFVILTAWFFSQIIAKPKMPSRTILGMILVASVASLMVQPDFGQSMLLIMTFFVIFFVTGMARILYAVGFFGFIASIVFAVTLFPHVAQRFIGFLDPTSPRNFQAQKSLSAFKNGDWFGKGPGEGAVKQQLPDAYSDFIFAVLGEEFGILACLAILAVIVFIVFRGLVAALKTDDLFQRLAITGLVTIFGFQSLINLSVSLRLIPTTGMTLPFVSYGLSSQLAIAFTVGLILALTRKRPRVASIKPISERT